MKTHNTKMLALAALGIALIATPAMAQTTHRHHGQAQTQYQVAPSNTGEFGGRVNSNGTPYDNTATATGGGEMEW